MNICHLTSVHSPSDTRIFLKECRSLQKNGHHVTLVAPQIGDTVVDDIHVIGFSPVANRFLRMLVHPWKVWGLAVIQKADVYHFHDPELIPVGLFLKMLSKPVIYDVHESSAADISSKSYLPFLIRRPAALLVWLFERIGGYVFDGIIAATPFIAEPFPKSKTEIVQNFPIIGELTDTIERFDYPGEDRIIYMGSLSDIRGIVELIEALELLPHGCHTKLVLVGRFSDTIFERKLKAMPGWGRVEYHTWQERKKLSRLMYRCRLGLILLHPAPNHYNAYPNKLFEYMSCGLPVLASDFPLWRRIVIGCGCGRLVDPTDPQKIAEGITWFICHPRESLAMGKAGQKAIQEKYHWGIEEAKLISFYRKMDGQ